MQIDVVRTPEEIENARARLCSARALGCDTETSGLNPRVGRLLSIQFSDGEYCVLVPVSEGIAAGVLGSLLADDAITKIFHNAKFDLEFLTAAGIGVRNVFDTMVAEKVLTRGADQSSSLGETLYRYFAVDLDKSQRAKFNRYWNGVWTDELVDYALSDVVHLPRLMQEQMLWLDRLGLNEELERQLEKVLFRA